MVDYEKISFDIYLVSGADNNYKKMQIYVDRTKVYEEDGYPSQAYDITWTTKEYALNNVATNNSFVLDLGISTNKGDYYIDNVKLYQKTSTSVENSLISDNFGRSESLFNPK